jgi:Tfp pilus assembly protein PilX
MRVVSGQAGAALVIALLLLMILAMLSVTGMRTTIAELWMAGNEQFRQRASAAASSGIERAIARVASGMDGSTVTDSFTTNVVQTGREAMLPGFSVGRLAAENYEITSTGVAARNAREEEVQGIAVISVTAGVQTYQRIGDGLEGSAP